MLGEKKKGKSKSVKGDAGVLRVLRVMLRC